MIMALSAAKKTAASALRSRITDWLGIFLIALLAVAVARGSSAGAVQGLAKAIPKDEGPTLLIAPALVVDPVSNAASGLLYLRNNSKSPATFSLTAGDFVSKTTGRRLGAKTSFTGATAGAQEQLAKLDLISAFIAIVLIGFTADTIRNLLTGPAAATQTNQPSAQPAK